MKTDKILIFFLLIIAPHSVSLNATEANATELERPEPERQNPAPAMLPQNARIQTENQTLQQTSTPIVLPPHVKAQMEAKSLQITPADEKTDTIEKIESTPIKTESIEKIEPKEKEDATIEDLQKKENSEKTAEENLLTNESEKPTSTEKSEEIKETKEKPIDAPNERESADKKSESSNTTDVQSETTEATQPPTTEPIKESEKKSDAQMAGAIGAGGLGAIVTGVLIKEAIKKGVDGSTAGIGKAGGLAKSQLYSDPKKEKKFNTATEKSIGTQENLVKEKRLKTEVKIEKYKAEENTEKEKKWTKRLETVKEDEVNIKKQKELLATNKKSTTMVRDRQANKVMQIALADKIYSAEERRLNARLRKYELKTEKGIPLTAAERRNKIDAENKLKEIKTSRHSDKTEKRVEAHSKALDKENAVRKSIRRAPTKIIRKVKKANPFSKPSRTPTPTIRIR